MITTQRVIIYRTDGDPDVFTFEILNSYDFNTSMTAVSIGLLSLQFLSFSIQTRCVVSPSVPEVGKVHGF
jgi:hypothetical protein